LTRTIVIAVEPATGGRVAWIGGELALRLDARAVLAHVQKDAPGLSSGADRERVRHQRERRARAILDSRRSAMPLGVHVEYRVALGPVVNRLSEIAEDEDASLIVVGSRGRGAMASTLFGSVSESLANAAPCPVMIVPPAPIRRPRPFDPAGGDPATMVAGTDGSAAASAAARFAEALADGMGHRLVVVRLRDQAGSRAGVLQAISATEDARMIVIGLEGQDGLRLRRGRSLAARLLRRGTCPVTVVPTGMTSALEG
jgi:nucleotide-binding universal stress UspA family protein